MIQQMLIHSSTILLKIMKVFKKTFLKKINKLTN